MRPTSDARRIWLSGSPIDVWEHPDARFSWTPNAIALYVHREQWESVFNALGVVGRLRPQGCRRVTLLGVRPAWAIYTSDPRWVVEDRSTGR